MASNDRFFGVLASQAIKVPCVRAVATNVTLSGDPGLIGTYQPLDNDRLLLVGQTNPVENGIWEVSLTGAWKRSPDFDGIRDATENTLVVVARESGSPVMYRLENTAPVVVGTDPLTFSQFFDPDNPATAGLQAVTDVGNTTDNEIITTGGAGFRSEQDLTNYVSIYHQPLNPTAVIEFGSSTTELQIGLGSGNFVTTRLPGSIAFLERSTAPPSQAIYGQLWVRDDSPNVLVFTDDAGTDFVIGDRDIVADISTATPPSTEAVTATLNYVDADRDDTLATLGFNGSNELLLRNHMRDGDIRIQQETAAGDTHTVLAAEPNQDLTLFYRNNRVMAMKSQGARIIGTSNPALEFFVEPGSFAGEIDCVVPGFMRIRSLQAGQPMGFYVTNGSNSTAEVFRATADRGVRIDGTLELDELAASPAQTVGYGQFWVRDDAPNTPMFTDDAGTDFVLNESPIAGGVLRTFRAIYEGQSFAVPSPNSFRFNAAPIVASNLYIDDSLIDGFDFGSIAESLEPGMLIETRELKDGEFVGYNIFRIDGPLVDNTGYWDIPVRRVAGRPSGGDFIVTRTYLISLRGEPIKGYDQTAPGVLFLDTAQNVAMDADFQYDGNYIQLFGGAGIEVYAEFSTLRSRMYGAGNSIIYNEAVGSTGSAVYYWDGWDSISFIDPTGINVRIQPEGGIQMREKASLPYVVPTAYGGLWVRSDAPTTLMFTDDAGNDYPVSGALAPSIPAGTVDDATLRWESTGSQWVEAPSFRIDEGGNLTLTKGGTASINLIQENGALDEKRVEISADDLDFAIQAKDDGGGNGGYVLRAFRVGDTWASCTMDLTAPTGNGAFTINAQTTPSLDLLSFDAASDESRWSLQCDGAGAIELLALAAGGVDTDAAFRVTRNLEIIDDFFFGSPIKIPEQASANASTATFGQFWVRNDAPNTPMFTDDAGNDFVLNQSPVAGGSIRSFRLNWEGAATASPASGNFAFQTTNPATATQLWFTDALADGYDIGLLMDQVEPGMFIELRRNDVDGAQDYNAYRVAAAPVDQAGNRWSVTVNWISGTGTLTASGSEYLFSIGGEAITNYSNTSRVMFTNGGNINHDDNFQYTGSNLELRNARNFLLYGSGSAFNRHRVSGTSIAYNEAFNFSPSAQYLFDRWDFVSFARAGSPDVRIYTDGAIDFREQASAPYTPAASFGGIWVRNDVPNTLMFTDDAGTDYEVAGSGVGGGGATVLNDLTDVNLTTPADASMLLYDTGTATWRDFAMSGDGTLNDVGLFTLGPTVTNAWTLENIQTVDTGGAIDFLDNVELRFGTGNDYELDFDGTNMILNRAVGTGGFQVQSPLLVRSGFALSIWDSTNNDRVSFQHDGTNLNVTEVGTGAIRLASIDLGFNDNDQLIFGNSNDVVIDFDGTDIEVTGIAATPIWNFRDNHRLRVWDSANADWLQIGHDGTNGLVGTGGTGGGSIGFEQNTFWNSQTETLSTNAATFTFSEGAGYEIDLETATGNVTLTLSGGPPSGKYGVMTIKVQQDGTAARTITWSGGIFRWAGGAAHPLTSTLNGFSIFTFETWDGGLIWYAGGNDYS